MTNKSWCLASLLLPQSWILHPRMPMDKGHGARQAVVVVNHKSQICSGFKSSSRRSHKISWDEPNIAHEISWSAGNPAAGKKNVAKSPVPTYSRYWLMVLDEPKLVPSRETLICLHGASGVQFHRAERAQNIPDSRWASAWHTSTPRLARIVMDQVIRRSWMNPETIRKL
jgi:hypothetical protein